MPKRYAGGIITATFKPLDPHGDENFLYYAGNTDFGASGLNVGTGDSQVRSSPTQIGGSSTWAKVFSNLNGECAAAIKLDGTLWTWGRNHNGQLGHDNIVYRSSPVQVGALTTWSKVALRNVNQLALKIDGSLWLTGSNNNGQLGNNTLTYRSSPVQLGTDTWSDATLGNTFVQAVRYDGTLWGWGLGTIGQIGNGQAVNVSSPTQVGALTNWSKVGACRNSCIATKTDGTIWSWGYNDDGQLGHNEITIRRSSPIQIGALTDWSLLSIYDYSVIAIKTNGTLHGWGLNQQNQLGLSSTSNRSSPTQIGSDTDWALVTPGQTHTMAVKTNGTLWAWGANRNSNGDGTGTGGLMLNDITNRNSPVQVGTSTTWVSCAVGFSSGETHSYAVSARPF